jgi:hypothetical protein
MHIVLPIILHSTLLMLDISGGEIVYPHGTNIGTNLNVSLAMER